MEIAKSTLSYLQITKPGNSTVTTAYLSRLVDSSSLSETVRARANMIPWLGVTINSLQHTQLQRLLKVHKHDMFFVSFLHINASCQQSLHHEIYDKIRSGRDTLCLNISSLTLRTLISFPRWFSQRRLFFRKWPGAFNRLKVEKTFKIQMGTKLHENKNKILGKIDSTFKKPSKCLAFEPLNAWFKRKEH